MAVALKIKESIASSSWIRKMFEEGMRLKQIHGADNVFDFSIGNPDAQPPKKFFSLLKRFAEEAVPGASGYMPNAGFADVRKKIAVKASAEQGLVLNENNIVMTVGAAGGLNVVFKTLLNPGDEVIVPAPYFVEYAAYVSNHGGVLKTSETKEDFSLDVDSIASLINTKTAAILINSPNNPTGKIYSPEDIASLSRILSEKSKLINREIYLISDEPYREIVYKSAHVAPVLSAYNNSIVVTSYSKTLSLPGERIGYIAFNPACDSADDLLAGMIMANRTLGFVNAPALMQRTVAEMTSEKVDVALYEKRKDMLVEVLRSAGYDFFEPQGAFYIFCKAPGGDDISFVSKLKEHLILAVPGSGFGKKGYFRLTFCVSEKTISNSAEAFKKSIEA
ncbi:MAG TPA: pyridoxal phosphate-dependent aminotransferase [Spirochaetota bacterium]|nr:pyridoxal phosphate-dependent aminotransferase [Spirochaetota bacterium]